MALCEMYDLQWEVQFLDGDTYSKNISRFTQSFKKILNAKKRGNAYQLPHP
jgi:hypothetical protein